MQREERERPEIDAKSMGSQCQRSFAFTLRS